MIHEFDLVTLKRAILDQRLPAGLEGTVVDTMHVADGFVTVEFFDRDETVAVLPVKLDDLQPLEQDEAGVTRSHRINGSVRARRSTQHEPDRRPMGTPRSLDP